MNDARVSGWARRFVVDEETGEAVPRSGVYRAPQRAWQHERTDLREYVRAAQAKAIENRSRKLLHFRRYFDATGIAIASGFLFPTIGVFAWVIAVGSCIAAFVNLFDATFYHLASKVADEP